MRSAGWLSTTPRPFAELVISRSDLLHFEAATPLYHAGDQAGGIFGLVEGGLELHLPARTRRSGLAYIGGPGFWAGDAAALLGSDRRITLVARASSWVLRLTRAELERITRESPATWPLFMALVARNLLTTIDVLDAVKRDVPAQRVAATLLHLVSSGPPGRPLPLSQSDLAAIAGLGRSIVNTVLARFEACGSLRRRYGVIEVVDTAMLHGFAENQ